MATHPTKKQAKGLGYGVALIARLAADYEGHAATLRKTIELITLDQSLRKRTTIASALDQAMAMDRERRAPAARRSARPGFHTNAAKLQRRQRTAAFLARFDQVETRPAPGNSEGNGIGVLLHNGYLKRKGKGYVRTAKPFDPEA